MQRMGQVIRLKPEALVDYKRLHAAVWPDVLSVLTACNITNYSIFLDEPEMLMFAYWEYTGTDFAADMARMKAEPRMHDWWRLTDPMQDPLPGRAPGEWWARMEPVFFHP